MKYKVCQEGVEALQQASGKLSKGAQDVMTAVQLCESNVSEYPDIIHVDSLAEALQNIRMAIGDASGPVEELAEILLDVADSYEEQIADDKIRGIGGN